MKASPNVPPALLELVAELREEALAAAEYARCELEGDYGACAGNPVFYGFERLGRQISDIAKRLETLSAELAKSWPTKDEKPERR